MEDIMRGADRIINGVNIADNNAEETRKGSYHSPEKYQKRCLQESSGWKK